VIDDVGYVVHVYAAIPVAVDDGPLQAEVEYVEHELVHAQALPPIDPATAPVAAHVAVVCSAHDDAPVPTVCVPVEHAVHELGAVEVTPPSENVFWEHGVAADAPARQ